MSSTRLCLDKQFLTAPFHLFGEGLPSFLQFRIRLMVHEIMRATTDNFSVKAGIPSLPIAEHNKICDWIQVVMWHLFTKHTSGYDLPHSLNPKILIPLLKAAGQTIAYTRCEGEFTGYDVDGRLIYPDLLTSPLSLNSLFGPPVTLLPGNLRVLTLPMAITVSVSVASSVLLMPPIFGIQ
ncbi:hypothetical protein B0H13DRAFT_1910147 [Mycena leptocephala]|nr:hypothetical protein B0H13DRAFT_1910147 [Mycena leptocephala]